MTQNTMTWREVFHIGYAPQMSEEQLRAMKSAILTEDENLIQGAITKPSLFSSTAHDIASNGCAVVYSKLKCQAMSIQESHQYLEGVMSRCDELVGCLGASSLFLLFFDSHTLDVLKLELVPEIEIAIRAKREERFGCLENQSQSRVSSKPSSLGHREAGKLSRLYSWLRGWLTGLKKK